MLQKLRVDAAREMKIRPTDWLQPTTFLALRTLSLRKFDVTDAVANIPHLQSLELVHCTIAAGVPDLLAKKKFLQSLAVVECNSEPSDDCLYDNSGLADSMQRLQVDGSLAFHMLTKSAVYHAQSLRVIFARMTDLQDVHMIIFNAMPNLEELWLSGNRQVRLTGLCFLRNLPRLRFLAIDGCGVPSTSIPEVLMTLTTLRRLRAATPTDAHLAALLSQKALFRNCELEFVGREINDNFRDCYFMGQHLGTYQYRHVTYSDPAWTSFVE
jgi:Leucine-rich repeat (LRR) protein